MKRAKWLILLMLLASMGAWAQVVSSITIGTTGTGLSAPYFFVDGTQYNTTQMFLWPQGSKHIVQFPEDINSDNGLVTSYQTVGTPSIVRWTFGGWKDNLGLLRPSSDPIQTITADPSITSLIATVTPNYQLIIYYPGDAGMDPSCDGAPADAPQDSQRQGVFYVNGTCYLQTVNLYLPPGPITLNAFPYPGFAFAGWNVGGGTYLSYLSTFQFTASTFLIPSFVPAKRVQFRSNPLGMPVVVDHTVVPTPATAGPQTYSGTNGCQPSSSSISGTAPPGYTPLCTGDFDFVPGSSHQIGAVSPQQDSSGTYWVFAGFSDGLGQNGTYVTDGSAGAPDTVIANFNPAVRALIVTLPGGLPILIDGRSNWPSATFIWGPGETHQVSAPQSVTDAQGRVYTFQGWSNGGPATQTITMPTDSQAFFLQANYQIDGQTQITSSPVGMTFTVNGSSCVTPCIVNATGGAQVSASIPATVASGLGSRYDFDSWSTGSTSTNLQVSSTAGLQVIVANYHASYLLTDSANPAGSATLGVSPPSSDGYYPAGTAVTVTATPKPGFSFVRWAGDFAGTTKAANLTMDAPRTVSSMLIPVAPPAAIINAAGPTPDGSVAPGSLISIFGQGLSTGDPAVGPTNPLGQSLAGASVTAGNMFFPLWFVSSGQINAQVPWELTPGNYTLTVHVTGQPDVTGPLTVSRNAPGVYYTQPSGGQPQAVAVHQNWTLVTPSSPAQRNEYVTIYVNGLGPVSPAGLDGFPAPVTPLSPAVDPVTVTINGTLTVSPYWAGASPGTNGTGVVILQITDQIPKATTLNIKVNTNGKSSTSVQLPVQ